MPAELQADAGLLSALAARRLIAPFAPLDVAGSRQHLPAWCRYQLPTLRAESVSYTGDAIQSPSQACRSYQGLPSRAIFIVALIYPQPTCVSLHFPP